MALHPSEGAAVQKGLVEGLHYPQQFLHLQRFRTRPHQLLPCTPDSLSWIAIICWTSEYTSFSNVQGTPRIKGLATRTEPARIAHFHTFRRPVMLGSIVKARVEVIDSFSPSA